MQQARATSLGHGVGMEVHDVRLPTDTLEPGENLHYRAGDAHQKKTTWECASRKMPLITDTGYENDRASC